MDVKVTSAVLGSGAIGEHWRTHILSESEFEQHLAVCWPNTGAGRRTPVGVATT